jgi:hypothetical protein
VYEGWKDRMDETGIQNAKEIDECKCVRVCRIK